MIRRMLARLAGAHLETLDRSPVDRPRFTTTGGVLLTTAAVAAVSACFAMVMAVHAPLWAGVVGGIAWGVVILNLDRQLIIGISKQHSALRNLLTAVPRLALAVLLGAVISTPLVLRIFQPEIDAQLTVLRAERTASFEQQLAQNPTIGGIPALEQRQAQAQAAADRSAGAVAEADPAVQAAEKKAATALATYTEAQQRAQCEIDGTCGTRTPGVAEAAREAVRARDIAYTNYQAAQRELETTRANAVANAGTSSASARAQAQRLTDELAAARATKERAQREFAERTASDDGLLARLEALGALAGDRSDLASAQLLLFLLFLSIEVLPVLVKLLQVTGPPTAYDLMVADFSESARREWAKEISRAEFVRDDIQQRQADLEHDALQRQYEAGVVANQLLVAEQAELARRAIMRWSHAADARAAAEVNGWFGPGR
ncbi:DUF4407 domain-containing protein [Actinokineospora terrae]|uniref:DUF4407 domain-containing protein n=1 Tax=Actinokineospora terrae TaxID=155974 RepID=A0A1H9XET7_9PSEU|nr:DUF4407 domain-containing protein [Actinokineospora terrae]SES44559.1 protein of unknown function [Actinokineospora terrae]